MSKVYVLDRDTRDVLGLIDQSYSSLVTHRRYQAMDTFEMYIDRQRLYASEIATGRFVYLPDRDDQIYVIEQILSDKDEVASDTLTVSGRSLEGPALAERLAMPAAGQAYDAQTGVIAETAMRHYVDANAGPGADASRQIPGLVLAADMARGGTVNAQARYQTVADVIRGIGLYSGLGYQIVFDRAANEFVFQVLEGDDLSADVFFDFAFETLEAWRELDSIADSKTVAVVAGQGEGAARDIVTRMIGTPTGFDRREAFLDARDVDVGNVSLLATRGDTFLAAAGPERRLEADPHQYGSFRYREHWNLGDKVLVRSVERNLAYTARVVEVHETHSASNPGSVTVVLDRPFPTIAERVSGSSAGGGVVDQGGGGSVAFGDDTHVVQHASENTARGGTSPLAVRADHHHGNFFRKTDSVFEGGEITLESPAGQPNINLDNYQGRFRIHTPGVSWLDVDATIDTPTTQAFGDAATPGVSRRLAFAGHKHGMPAAPSAGALVGVKAVRTATQTITTATDTDILFTAADEWDTDGFHDPAVNSDRVTIPAGKGGKYLIVANCEFPVNGTGQRKLTITVNGGLAIGGINTAAAPNLSHRCTVTVEAQLAAGDIVRASVRQNSGGNLNIELASLSVRRFAD